MSPKARQFIKYDVRGNLFGSLRYELSPAEYSIWDRFLALAKIGECEGIISIKEWPRDSIVSLFNLAPYGGLTLLNQAIDKLVKHECLAILEDGSLSIVNWHKYQDVPAWVVQQREALFKKVSFYKKKAEENHELVPSAELSECASKIDNASKVIQRVQNERK